MVTIQHVVSEAKRFENYVIPECSYRESISIMTRFPITTLGNDELYEVLVRKIQDSGNAIITLNSNVI